MSPSEHLKNRRVMSVRHELEREEAAMADREARSVVQGEEVIVVCSLCRARSTMPVNGVPKVKCSSCGTVLVARQVPRRIENR